MDWRQIARTHLPDITGDPVRDEEIAEELAQHLAIGRDEAHALLARDCDKLAIVGGAGGMGDEVEHVGWRCAQFLLSRRCFRPD